MENIIFYSICVSIGQLGMVIHFLKRRVKGQSFSTARKYFINHFKDTATAFATTAVFVCSTVDPAMGLKEALVPALMAGYTFDSMLNRDGGEK